MKNLNRRIAFIYMILATLIICAVSLSFGFSVNNNEQNNILFYDTYDELEKQYKKQFIELSKTSDYKEIKEYSEHYSSSKPLRVGLTKEYFYAYEVNGNNLGVNFMTLFFLNNILNIPIEFDFVYTLDFDYYDIIFTPALSEDIVEDKDLEFSNYFSRDFYIYSTSEPSSDLSNYINSTIYIPNKYKHYVSTSQLENFNSYNINLIFTDSDEHFLNSNSNNVYYIDTELYGLKNSQPFYTKISKNFIGTKEKIYFNKNMNKLLVKEINNLLNSSDFNDLLQNYYTNLLQLDFINNVFFTEEELDLIEKSTLNPFEFENSMSQSTFDYYNPSIEKWQGPLIQLWEEVSFLSGINYNFTVRKDKSFDDILKELGKTPSTIDGTFTILNMDMPNENFYHINTDYETTIVFIGKVHDDKIYTSDNLYDSKIGMIESSTFNNYILESTNGLDVYLYSDLKNAYDDLDTSKINLLALSYENFRRLFYEQNIYDIEIKKITPIVLDYTSAISKNNDYSKTLYSIVAKSLLVIDETDVFSDYLKSSPTNVKNKLTYNKHVKNIEKANILLFILVCLVLFLYVNNSLKLTRTTKKLFLIQNKAFEDSLTSLKNNIAFTNDLDNKNINGTIFVVNINNFRFFDINYSHNFGNQVLKNLAYTLLSFSIENSLQIYRVGNDTFALVSELPISKDNSLKIANKIVQATKDPFRILEEEVQITIRIGISTCSDKEKAEETYYKAESASITAKQRLKEESNPICIVE